MSATIIPFDAQHTKRGFISRRKSTRKNTHKPNRKLSFFERFFKF